MTRPGYCDCCEGQAITRRCYDYCDLCETCYLGYSYHSFARILELCALELVIQERIAPNARPAIATIREVLAEPIRRRW
jgi:hypothetical protein